MGSFCKQATCPSSEELAALQNSVVYDDHIAELEYHLSICEFCSAEAEFYRLYAPIEETITVEQMPRPLFELAESLLNKKHDLTPLYNLVNKTG